MSHSKKLYERCEHCEGTRKLVREIPTGRMIGATGELYPEVYPVGSLCPMCKTGYNEIGMTDIQLEQLIEERDALLSFAQEIFDTMPAPSDLVSSDRTRRTVELRTKAAALTRGKCGRIDEYRFRLSRRANRPSPQPEALPPVPPHSPPGTSPEPQAS